MTKKKKVSSVNKGKDGERAAAHYIRSLGFEGARRTAQHCGDSGDADLVCDSLPGLFIEVKFGYPLSAFDSQTQLFRESCDKAIYQARRKWVILWKPRQHSQWRMAFYLENMCVTVATDRDIRRHLSKHEEQ